MLQMLQNTTLIQEYPLDIIRKIGAEGIGMSTTQK
jgi:hypothetical protein